MHVGDTLGAVSFSRICIESFLRWHFVRRMTSPYAKPYSRFVLNLLINIFNASGVLEFVVYMLLVALVVFDL